MLPSSKPRGFTLAELLISLAILGVIATFTIPKVLTAQQNSQYNAKAKEAASIISGAYQAYQAEHTATASTKPEDLTPYMNYVKLDTTSIFDDMQNGLSYSCSSATVHCLKLHSGSILEYGDAAPFGGTNATNALFFYFDPDGVYSGSATGQGKSVLFFLYTNGMLRTYGTALPGTYSGIYGGTAYTADPSSDPPWFSWAL